MLGSLALGAASAAVLPGCSEGYEKVEASDVQTTIFAKVINGRVLGGEVILNKPGHYIIEVFGNPASNWHKRNQSLLKVEFDVTETPRRELLSDWEPGTSVLMHVSMVGDDKKLKTQAVRLAESNLPPP